MKRYYRSFDLLLPVINGMMKIIQAPRNIRLPIKYHVSPLLTAEAMKKPAQIMKRSQPAKENLLPIFPIYNNQIIFVCGKPVEGWIMACRYL
jgi:hypothetical protein